ncbi:hypothetical protein RHGRI_028869 [Rhododendron griersonianum]|uniref:RING-CH-type domain-containing protein n=1 Tax=Rhododendron griersonianum TaxID=479676 RepID=A0AAV6II67_9ERIC|nr:hypothetical protein RHGRI_028869 [Rhododendron griersonianum]
MGDHFALLVDRLLTESTLEAVIESRKRLEQAMPSTSEDVVNDFHSYRMAIDSGSSPRKLVECKICQDEDEDSNMEIPCSCRGSLKFKLQHMFVGFEKFYRSMPTVNAFKDGAMRKETLFVRFATRGNWEVSSGDIDPPFIDMVATDRIFLHSDLDDYSPPTSISLICCRVFMVLLVLRHTLPIITSEAGNYTINLVMLLMFRTIGILFPIYIVGKAFTAIQRRRHQQEVRNSPLATSDEENELL